MREAIVYYRVSTPGQGESGLGLEAQQMEVNRFVRMKDLHIVQEFIEVESAKKHTNRPKLLEALACCRSRKALLLIAKLDRLARNVAFVSSLIESSIKFIAVDMPDATKVMLQIHAVFGELERDLASIRTREALQAAKERGVELGKHGKVLAQINKQNADAFAMRLQPIIVELQEKGITGAWAIAQELSRRKIPTFRNRSRWHPKSVHNILKRLRLQNTVSL